MYAQGSKPSIFFVSDNIGSHTPVMPKLLAHELGHLLGSEHDGQAKANYHSSIYAGQTIPCPEGKNLMSPSVSK